MGKHTPGPWAFNRSATPEWCKQYTVYAKDDPTGKNIALIYDSGEATANACLIAAAPELLESCKIALNILDAESDACAVYSAHRQIIEDAVKKATEE